MVLGRKSIAEKYYSEIPDDEEEGTWLVLYDFKKNKTRARHNLLVFPLILAKLLNGDTSHVGLSLCSINHKKTGNTTGGNLSLMVTLQPSDGSEQLIHITKYPLIPRI